MSACPRAAKKLKRPCTLSASASGDTFNVASMGDLFVTAWNLNKSGDGGHPVCFQHCYVLLLGMPACHVAGGQYLKLQLIFFMQCCIAVDSLE